MQKIIGLGAGGHAKGIIEILRSQGCYELVGLLDPDITRHGTDLFGVPILGGDSLLPELPHRGVQNFFVGVGGVGNNDPRQRLFEMAVKQGLTAPDISHSQAVVSPSAQLGGGVIIMPGAVVNADAILGVNVIVNTRAVVEHDCVICDHTHIATGAQLAGAVHVGRGAHIGIGAAVKQGVQIGAGAIVGAGATVIRDVRAGATVIGVPAREIHKSKTGSIR